MELFDEIMKEKKDFPKMHSVTKKVKKYKFNFYQIFAIGIFVVCFFLGIIFGNLFATCDTVSYYYLDACLVREFNYSLMLAIWFVSLLISLTFFSMGHMVALLTEINENIQKFRD